MTGEDCVIADDSNNFLPISEHWEMSSLQEFNSIWIYGSRSDTFEAISQMFPWYQVLVGCRCFLVAKIDYGVHNGTDTQFESLTAIWKDLLPFVGKYFKYLNPRIVMCLNKKLRKRRGLFRS